MSMQSFAKIWAGYKMSAVEIEILFFDNYAVHNKYNIFYGRNIGF